MSTIKDDQGAYLSNLIVEEMEEQLLAQKIQAGKALQSQGAVNAQSQQIGKALENAIDKHVTTENLPNGTLYRHIASDILNTSLKNTYQKVNATATATQKKTDTEQGVHFAIKQAEYPQDKIDNLLNKCSSSQHEMTTADKNYLKYGASQLTSSFSDDFQKTNATFRQTTGLQSYITRTGGGKCCVWCQDIEGRYKLENAPPEIWKRHRNCSCILNYYNAKTGTRSTRVAGIWHVSQIYTNQAQLQDTSPKKFTQQEAKISELASTPNNAKGGTKAIIQEAKKTNVKYHAVKKNTKTLSTEQIIQKVGVNDVYSPGSCVSLALSYIANRHGYDVQDYRGDHGTFIFSGLATTQRFTETFHGESYTEQAKKVCKKLHQILTDQDKEYYFQVPGHAMIIRKHLWSLQYLDLQHAPKNMFKNFSTHEILYVLCDRRQNGGKPYKPKQQIPCLLTPIENFAGEEFQELLGYIHNGGENL